MAEKLHSSALRPWTSVHGLAMHSLEDAALLLEAAKRKDQGKVVAMLRENHKKRG